MSVDSQVLASFDLGDFVTPHFPPLYPVMLRVIGNAALWTESVFTPLVPNYGFVKAPVFTSLAAVFTLLLQHVFCCFAAASLARVISTTLVGARILTAIFYLNPVTLSLVHSVMTEAVAVSFVLMACCATVKLLTGRQAFWRSLGSLLCWSLLAALSRHALVLLAILAPLAIASQMMLSQRSHLWQGRLTLGVAIAGAVVVFIANDLANRAFLYAINVEHRSVLGRAFTYRLSQGSLSQGGFMPGLNEASWRTLVDNLQASAKSDKLRRDIALVAESKAPWVEPFNKVTEATKPDCLEAAGCKLWAETDRRLNAVAIHSLLHGGSPFNLDALMRAAQYLTPEKLQAMKAGSLDSGWPATSTFDREVIERPFLVKSSEVIAYLAPAIDWLRRYSFTLAIIVFVVSLRYTIWTQPFQAAVLGVCVLYAAALSLLSVYVGRYGLLIDQLSIISAAAGVTDLIERFRSRRFGPSLRQPIFADDGHRAEP